MRGGNQGVKIGQGAIAREDTAVIRDVVAIVAQGGGEDGEHPNRVHTERANVIQAGGQAGEVAPAVAV